MKLSNLLSVIAATVLLAAQAANAAPVLLDFEGVAGVGQQIGVGNTYSQDGFQLFNPGSPRHGVIVDTVGQNDTGSDYYAWNYDPSNNPITLTSVNGNAFSLAGLDVGTKSAPSFSTSFNITGHLSNGNTVLYHVIDASAFSHVTLDGFNDLLNVTFNWVSGDYSAIDNLELNTLERNNVPEPMSISLVGLGLAGLVANRRRKSTLDPTSKGFTAHERWLSPDGLDGKFVSARAASVCRRRAAFWHIQPALARCRSTFTARPS